MVFCAVIRNPVRPVGPDGTLAEPPHRLVILDWDVSQIEGALLETWLPTVFQQLEHLARKCRARMGSLGAMIEDKTPAWSAPAGASPRLAGNGDRIRS